MVDRVTAGGTSQQCMSNKLNNSKNRFAHCRVLEANCAHVGAPMNGYAVVKLLNCMVCLLFMHSDRLQVQIHFCGEAIYRLKYTA